MGGGGERQRRKGMEKKRNWVGVAQWVKSSLCKLENLSSDPNTHLKRGLGL